MKTWYSGRLLLAFAFLGIAALCAAPKNATEKNIDASIAAVAASIEPAFRELKIVKVEGSTLPFYAMAVGKVEAGSRVVVSITGAGKDKSKATVTTDTPRDPALETKILAAMAAHVGK